MPARWRRHGLAALVVGLLTAGVVYDRSTHVSHGGGDQERYHDQTFRVVHVVDGDTLDIDAPDGDKPKTRIRLWGVDTPEIAHGGEPEMAFGKEALEFARRTLDGHEVHIVLSPKKSRDKYGRLLAFVYVARAGPMFNEMLLEEGLAYADLRFNHPYAEPFKAAEARARKTGAGLWATITLDQMPPWKQRFEGRKRRSDP